LTGGPGGSAPWRGLFRSRRLRTGRAQPDIAFHVEDDILEIRISDKAVAREVSHGWNVNISYAEDGSVVEIVLLEAMEKGLYPVVPDQAA